MTVGPQRQQPDVPPDWGTQPVPKGTVRFHHYTWREEAAEGIRQHGLLRSKAEESYARGGTEFPQTFATAGLPGEDVRHGGVMGSERIWIEGYAHPEQLDTGAPWGVHISEDQMGEHIKHLESGHHTLTFHGDIPPHQIMAIHKPWHSALRYQMENPDREAAVMHGNYDEILPALDKANEVVKIAGAAKVMLGGKLEGEALW